MTAAYAADIVTWRYLAPYDCYDMTGADPEGLVASGQEGLRTECPIWSGPFVVTTSAPAGRHDGGASGKDSPVQRNAIILYRTGAGPGACWYPWLSRRLAGRGYAVGIPHYPGLNVEPIATFNPKPTRRTHSQTVS